MTAQLRETLEGLEQRVAERTEELGVQNAELEALHETTLGVMDRLEIDELLTTLLERAGQLAGIAARLHLPRDRGRERDREPCLGRPPHRGPRPPDRAGRRVAGRVLGHR